MDKLPQMCRKLCDGERSSLVDINDTEFIPFVWAFSMCATTFLNWTLHLEQDLFGSS